jgi:hypothetical protein
VNVVTDTTMSNAPTIHGPLGDFAVASSTFARSLDTWLARWGRDRGESGSRRLVLLGQRYRLDRLAAAGRAVRSIAFYGESQCGKSNIVSRIGQGLGAGVTADGSLLVHDASTDPARQPWAADGHAGAIEFAKWLNPVSNREATGIICRFTASGPEPAEPGCYVAKLLSHSDLIISLAIGMVDDVVDDPGSRDVARSMKELQDAPIEDDVGGFMGEVLHAWRFLREWRLDASPRLRELDAAGFEDFARTMFLAGKRPAWNPKDVRGSAFQRYVSLLWDGQHEMSEVHRRLLSEIERLGGADEVSVPVADVCRTDGSSGPGRSSLLDIGHIDRLFDEVASAGAVQVHYRTRQGAVRTAGMSRSALVALVRELVLPVAAPGSGSSSDVDVLDFPGARSSSASESFAKHAEPSKLALQVLRRGKLNRLFLAGVEHEDCSALCLVVTGNGNLEAGAVVKQSLKAWLGREGWVPADEARPPELLPHEAPPEPVDPPLVVAISKSDTLLDERGLALFGSRLKEIDAKYCGGLPWLEQWSQAGPFRRVHWVHNPSLDISRKPARLPDAAKAAIRAAYRADEEVLLHVDQAEDRLEALLCEPPRDVRGLFETLRSVVLRVDRDERIVESVLDQLELLVRDTDRDYLGRNDPARIKREREDAVADVAALELALGRGLNPVSEFLRALQMTAADAQRAYAEAADERAGRDSGEVGTVGFDDFYTALRQRFALRLDERLRRGGAWLQFMQDSRNPGQGRVASLEQHFRDMPSAAWFRGRVEAAVGAMVRNQNASTLANPALGAITASLWNRSMVWLDRVPGVERALPPVPPKLRPSNAASEKILGHWRERLPEVYANLVDPRNTSRPGNEDLGILRSDLLAAVLSMLAAMQASRGPSRRTAALEARLGAMAASLGAES